jgi:ABC transport system ATP-binding/permease protein
MTIGLDGSGRVDLVAGGYRELEALRQSRVKTTRTVAKPASPAARSATPGPPAVPARKLNFRDQHDLDKLPDLIAALEADIQAIEKRLSDPQLYARAPAEFERLTKETAALRIKVSEAELRWLEVAEKAESLS